MGHMNLRPHSILFGSFHFGETTERTVLGGRLSAGACPPLVVITASNGNCYAIWQRPEDRATVLC
jgi:hypothetical protein